MKTIKIIDLLNKIANNEIKDGTKFKMLGNKFIYKNGYITFDTKIMCELYISQAMLNDEVEIIEEEKELKKVLEIELLGQCDNWLQKRDVNIKSDFELNPYIINTISKNFELLYKKQCEIVDAVNELRKEK